MYVKSSTDYLRVCRSKPVLAGTAVLLLHVWFHSCIRFCHDSDAVGKLHRITGSAIYSLALKRGRLESAAILVELKFRPPLSSFFSSI